MPTSSRWSADTPRSTGAQRRTQFIALPTNGAQHSLGCPNAYRDGDGTVHGKIDEALVTTSCLRIVASTGDRADDRGYRNEYRILFASKY